MIINLIDNIDIFNIFQYWYLKNIECIHNY